MNLYLILAIISCLSLTTQNQQLSQLLTWDRSLIISGEWWRILTGNITHTNLSHFLMNMVALWLISLIFTPRPRKLLLLLIIISLVIGLGLFASDIQRYVGLSGTLHGLFGYFAVKEALSGKRSSWLLVIGVIGKVVSEQVFGASATSAALIAAPVAIEAHLIGLIAGLMLALNPFRT